MQTGRFAVTKGVPVTSSLAGVTGRKGTAMCRKSWPSTRPLFASTSDALMRSRPVWTACRPYGPRHMPRLTHGAIRIPQYSLLAAVCQTLFRDAAGLNQCSGATKPGSAVWTPCQNCQIDGWTKVRIHNMELHGG